MATYVLVHGGGHGGGCYKKVTRRLEAAGHEVFAPTLAGMAERSRLLSPAIDLDHHIEDIARELFYWDLRDVILAGHSYGGMVITGAADRSADRVGKLVFLDAANPGDGQSLADLAGPMITSQQEFSQVPHRPASPARDPGRGFECGPAAHHLRVPGISRNLA